MPTEVFQSGFDPSAGHDVDQPVSFEMPSQSDPRQRGQSLATARYQPTAQSINTETQAVGTTGNRARNQQRRGAGKGFLLIMAAELMQVGASVNFWGVQGLAELVLPIESETSGKAGGLKS